MSGVADSEDGRFAYLGEALERLAAKGLKRRHRLVEPAAPPHRTRVRRERDDDVEGRFGAPLVHLCSNDYLGLATDSRVIAAAHDALARYGTGATASRLVSGHCPLHAHLEAALAELKHQQAALVFPTGYAANLGVLGSIVEPRDLIVADELNHASLIDGCRLSRATVRRYPHGDLAALRALLDEHVPACRGRVFLVTDGVFSMDGDVAPLVELAALADEHEALLIIDDAHGTGVLGATGAGTAEHLGLSAQHPGIVHIGTLSKALGSQGGFVAGPRVLIDYLVNTARSHIFTTGLAPACAAAALAAVEIVRGEPQRRERLQQHAATLRSGLRELGYTLGGGDDDDNAAVTPIVPVIVGEAEAAVRFSQRLIAHGILAVAIRPPAVPPGSARIRLTVMATHTDAEIDAALAAFAALRDEFATGGGA